MTVRIDVVTIFPDVIAAFASASLLGKAADRGLIEVIAHDLRDYTTDKHRQVDDEPYGGGPGMVMKPEPFFAAVKELKCAEGAGHAGGVDAATAAHVVLLTPSGRRLDQQTVKALASRPHLVLLCGRYEGVDERVAENLVDEELSIGDYVLAGGEAAAIVVIDAVARILPGVVGDPDSVIAESFENGLLDYPQYTRPEVFEERRVPDVLLSGHHAQIATWRREQSERRTRERRPDLGECGNIS